MINPSPPRSYFTSMLQCRCPRCREGKMFKSGNVYTEFTMHNHCYKCGTKFRPEPGFYQGAMFVSYGFGIMLLVFAFMLTAFFENIPAYVFIVSYSIVIIAIFPFVYKMSRTIYLSIFVHYYDEAISKFNNENRV